MTSLNTLHIPPIGLGCMNLSHGYGSAPTLDEAEALLLHAIEHGVAFFDTASLYGFGENEKLIGKVLKPYRKQFILASKCGMHGVNGVRVIDGRPETIRANCESSLKNLQTDVIDLYYLHRWDKKVPIEESVGALADLVKAGKIKHIGLSEVSALTLKKAHAVHPIAAVQSEYSLWTRNPEIAVLEACKALGTYFVAFSPLGRGYLSHRITDVQQIAKNDIRVGMPRFSAENYPHNYQVLQPLLKMAQEIGCTAAQIALAWVLAQGKHVVAIPGTTQIKHLEDNMGATRVQLSPKQMQQLNEMFAPIKGTRYNASTQTEIDTEEF